MSCNGRRTIGQLRWFVLLEVLPSGAQPERLPKVGFGSLACDPLTKYRVKPRLRRLEGYIILPLTRQMNTNFDLLLAEDNPDDVFLLQQAFKKAAATGHLHTVPDGLETLSYL